MEAGKQLSWDTRIMLALAEYDSGVWSLPEFQREYLNLAAPGQVGTAGPKSSAAAPESGEIQASRPRT